MRKLNEIAVPPRLALYALLCGFACWFTRRHLFLAACGAVFAVVILWHAFYGPTVPRRDASTRP